MGWFSNKEDTKKEYHPNNRSSRKHCWDARDEFFQCLDKINVVNALDPAVEGKVNKSCSTQEKKFNENCATSWISYFKEKRVVDYKKEQFLKEMEQQNAQKIELTPEQVMGNSGNKR